MLLLSGGQYSKHYSVGDRSDAASGCQYAVTACVIGNESVLIQLVGHF